MRSNIRKAIIVAGPGIVARTKPQGKNYVPYFSATAIRSIGDDMRLRPVGFT
jgi:hypothetical protein